MSQEDRLAKFIRRIGQPGTGYTGFVLVQCLSSRGESLLRKFDIDAEYGIDETKVAELAAEVFVTATEDADGHLGLSSYCLYGLKGTSKHERSPVIRLRNQSGDDGSLEDTEPATTTGVTAQLMRHLEAIQRSSLQKDEIHARATTEIIRSQNERIAHYEKFHWENVLKAEELANEKESRELNRLRSIAKDKRLDDAFKTMKPLVPLLLSKWTGLPAGAKPELTMEALKSLMSNITPDMMTQIANILGPQSLALAELYMDTHQEANPNVESATGESPKH